MPAEQPDHHRADDPLRSALILRDTASGQRRLRISYMLAPLVLCVLGLGLYNLVRFGNPLETGLTYQLTIPEFQKITYALAYVPSNLYVYLAYPLTGAEAFPFPILASAVSISRDTAWAFS